jgi:capsular polysaccharide transport system permease protein
MSLIDRYNSRGPGRFFGEVRSGARNQANVIFALIFKDFKRRTGRFARLGVFWAVFDPMTQVIVLSLMWLMFGRTTIDGVHVVLFIAVATAPYTIVQKGLSSIPRAVAQNRAFYAYQQVKPFDSLAAEWVLEMSLILLGEFLLFFGMWWFFDLVIDFYNILPLLGLLLLAMALSFGLALAAAAYSAIFDSLPRILGLLTRPLIFVSGVFYAVGDLPAQVRQVLSWNPIVQAVEYARFYALGIKPFPEADLEYAMFFTISALFFGFLSYSAFRVRMLQR